LLIIFGSSLTDDPGQRLVGILERRQQFGRQELIEQAQQLPIRFRCDDELVDDRTGVEGVDDLLDLQRLFPEALGSILFSYNRQHF
jgi:hypothetical protein